MHTQHTETYSWLQVLRVNFISISNQALIEIAFLLFPCASRWVFLVHPFTEFTAYWVAWFYMRWLNSNSVPYFISWPCLGIKSKGLGLQNQQHFPSPRLLQLSSYTYSCGFRSLFAFGGIFSVCYKSCSFTDVYIILAHIFMWFLVRRFIWFSSSPNRTPTYLLWGILFKNFLKSQ